MASQLRADTERYLFNAGGKHFSIVDFHASEGLSSLFKVSLNLAVEEEASPDELLGQPGLVTLEGDHKRYFHGIISQFESRGIKGRFFLYHVTLRPLIWLAGQQQDCRIFQDLNTPDIISSVLTENGMTTDMFAFRLQGNYAPRTYCVQYRESDLDFVSRLLEEEGIFYFFEFTESNHLMVFGDSTVNYQPIAGGAKVVFNEGGRMIPEEECVYTFRRSQCILPGKFTHTDFNFEKPSLDLQADSSGDDHDDLEIYDNHGAYFTQEHGSRLASVRLEQQRMYKDKAHGDSVCPRMVPGFTFSLAEHDTDDFNAEYLILTVTHEGHQPHVLRERAAEQPETGYTNAFSGIPSGVPVRPEQRTAKPMINGVQTAIVTGPSGEEIYPDEYGRVKVQFHWDRLGKLDERSSCWVRVSQQWAGTGWGAMFIPRIGHEVIVDFIEGDPDRPIITGRVYNGSNMPPYELPADKTKSTIKTNSSKEGQGCNEIRFEDSKGEEELFVQAEKDMNLHIKNDQKQSVHRDCHQITHRDLLEKVERDHHAETTGNTQTKIGGDNHLKVDGKSAIDIGTSLSVKVGGDVIDVFNSNHTESVTNGYKLQAVTAVIEATANITLKCGSSGIVLTPAGIFLQGTILNLNSGAGPAGSVSAGSLVAPTAPLAAVAVGAVTAGMSEADAAAHDAPAHQPTEEEEEEKSWIEIELVDEDDNPVAGEQYRLTLPDGTTVAQGTTDDKGIARVSGIDPGSCQVTFPKLDKDAWDKA